MWPVRRKWPLLEGTYRKVDLLYRWSVRHTILLGRVCDPLLGGGLIANGGLIYQIIR